MAIASGAIWEIRTSADAGNVGGGFFVTGASGSDFSQQNSPQYALTGVTSSGAGNTILTASAAADMVGNGIKVISGTNFTVSWFEITSVSIGVSITCSTNAAGASISTGVGASGVMNVGGAISLGTSGASGDDDVFEAGSAGNKWYIKLGTYTLGETVSIALVGTSTSPIKVYGYQTTRDDNPIGTNRPTFACGANVFSTGQFWWFYNFIFTGTASSVISFNNESLVVNCFSINKSTSGGRNAFSAANDMFIFNCEAVSYIGRGISVGSSVRIIISSCWIHECSTGILVSSASSTIIDNCIVSSCITVAIQLTIGNISQVKNCTLYGSENTTSIGLAILTGSSNVRVINNILYGFTTGVSYADTSSEGFDDYNDYFNNDNDVNNTANWQKGSNDVAINPAFAGVAQLTGTTATTSGSVLTQSGGDFSTVVDGRDYLYLVSGTGITAGIYGITAHTATTVTLDNAPGTNATADKVWQITTGHNFAITGAI